MLALDEEGTFSLKYNLAVDDLIGEPLFARDFKERELDHYLTKKNRYGIPLDSRNTYTKTDWLLWAACLTENKEKRKEVIGMVHAFLCETADRVPFSDWIDTVTGEHLVFRNRTVQGGLFMPILVDNRKK